MQESKPDTETTWVDPDDAPELDDAWFERAELRIGDRVIRPGRPKAGVTKLSTTVRFDADIVEAFRAEGSGWQTRMNQALREWLNQRTKVA